jgi:hypothetical protein
MVIVETKTQLVEFYNEFSKYESVIFPMWVDNQYHPMRLSISFIFVRCNGVDYILPIDHIDCINIPFPVVKRILETPSTKKIVYSLKSLLYTIKVKNGIDGDSLLFLSQKMMRDSYRFDWKNELLPLYSFYNSMGYTRDIIKSIPILKLGEVIQNIISNITKLDITDDIKWYSEKVIPTLSKVEESGLYVDRNQFLHKVGKVLHLTDDNKIYTEYNPYTITGRPSNRHGGINYSAMNKSDGSRELYIAGRGNFLVQFDYDSYHLRIIGGLIDLELPSTSVHQWLADQYGSTYEESKSITFRQIYGGIDNEFLTIPFFSKTKEFIDRLWDTVNEVGYIQTNQRQIPLKWIETPDPYKVFNYLLQSVETEINVVKMDMILDIIQDKNIELVLYTYDSFVFRSPTETDINEFKPIIEVLEEGGFPVKRKIGYTFGEL